MKTQEVNVESANELNTTALDMLYHNMLHDIVRYCMIRYRVIELYHIGKEEAQYDMMRYDREAFCTILIEVTYSRALHCTTSYGLKPNI